MNRRFKLFRALKIAVMITLFINMAGFGTMYLWNWLVPLLFHGPVITFLQALGLLVLSKILFGGFGRGGRFGGRRRWQRRMQERFANMTPEEREKFSQQMQGRCGGRYNGFQQSSPVSE
ncbi:MAG: hypothetical protein U0X41_00470 [Chitinophagales bacterium]